MMPTTTIGALQGFLLATIGLIIVTLFVPAVRPEVGRRLGPFLALLDARYLPLLFTVAPQAYAVYDWLGKSGAPEEIRWLGAIGYEAVYVGAIAWAEYDSRQVGWSIATATAALCFSVAVAAYNYQAEGWGAWLHAGFPVVAYFYTLQMHMTSRPSPVPSGLASESTTKRHPWRLASWRSWFRRQSPPALPAKPATAPADAAPPPAPEPEPAPAAQPGRPILRAPRERFEIYAALVDAVGSDPRLLVGPLARRLQRSETLIGTRRKELLEAGVLEHLPDKTYRVVGAVERAQ